MIEQDPQPSPIDRVLVVEDEGPLRRGIATLVRRTWGAQVLEAATSRQAHELLRHAPDLIIADVCLPDGSALSFLEESVGHSPEPLKIAISGAASAEQAFAAAQLGARAFLSKPFTLQQLCDAVERARREAPAVEPLVRASVGRVAMRDFQRRMRSVMIEQALALSEGSCTRAARLLRISRQAVQQVERQRLRDCAQAARLEEDPALEASEGSRSHTG